MVSTEESMERTTPAEHLVQNCAEREDIAAVIDRPAAHLLGRHLPGRSHDRSRLGAAVRLGHLVITGCA